MTEFQHRQAAHCESGVTSALITHAGLSLSEPMAFGLASALAFAYIPIVKLAGMPLISYRMWPGADRSSPCEGPCRGRHQIAAPAIQPPAEA